MIWAPVLHIYQPPTQFPKIMRKVAEESYEPLISFLERNPKAKVTLNINASLLEQLDSTGYDNLLNGIRRLVERGQVELLGSAAYHPLLTHIPFSEISRQVRLNEKITRGFIGEVYKPRGFFPPEMAYSEKVGDAVAKLGYEWVIIENCGSPDQLVHYDRVYELPNQKLSIFYRQKELSLAIAFGRVSGAAEFMKLAKKRLKEEEFILTALDGETFGHHMKGNFDLLGGLYAKFKSVTVSELFLKFSKREKTTPMESTWAASYEDCKKGEVYPRWDNPGSPLHPKQWELYRLAIEAVGGSKFKVQNGNLKEKKLSSGQKKWFEARKILDKALHSDQFWWASHNPIWHPEMVERGTKLLLDVILTTPGISKVEAKRAKELYKEITTEGVRMYGTELILTG